MTTSDKRSWIVKVECTVLKELICDSCTEDEARSNPFKFCVQETEKGTPDYEVKSVEENK